MIRHCAFFKFRAGVSADERAEIYAGLGALVGQIDGLLSADFGPNVSPEGLARGFNDGFIMDFVPAVAKGLESFNKEAKVLDAHLARQPYLVGKEITLADFSVAAPLFYTKEAELPIGSYARLQEWFGRVSALPCWRETAPQFAAAAA